jgi:hypothetical protein
MTMTENVARPLMRAAHGPADVRRDLMILAARLGHLSHRWLEQCPGERYGAPVGDETVAKALETTGQIEDLADEMEKVLLDLEGGYV